MNVLDVIIIVLLIAAAIGGLANGLIKSLFSLAGVILGVVLAGRFYAGLAEHLTFISNSTAANIVAFAIIFIIVMIVAAIAGFIITKLVSAMLLGWLNRLGGAVFSAAMGAVFIAGILAVWVKMADIYSVIQGSALASFLLDSFPFILGLLPEEFKTIQEFFQLKS
jgi:membrane protein required for colicin V production